MSTLEYTVSMLKTMPEEKLIPVSSQGILRAEVQLTKVKAIRAYTDVDDIAGQICMVWISSDTVVTNGLYFGGKHIIMRKRLQGV